MDYSKHSLLSQRKFGGQPSDYLPLHKFIDSGKLFYYNNKHRLLLHNLYGVELCTELFGDCLINSDNTTILTRDIAAEHCKEDLNGYVPTLEDWFKDYQSANLEKFSVPELKDSVLAEFIFKPYLRSGINATLFITCTNFGVYLIEKKFGTAKALEFSKLVQHNPPVHSFLQDFSFSHKWQYTPDKKELIWLKQISNGTTGDQEIFN
jgi:hypothetical protein